MCGVTDGLTEAVRREFPVNTPLIDWDELIILLIEDLANGFMNISGTSTFTADQEAQYLPRRTQLISVNSAINAIVATGVDLETDFVFNLLFEAREKLISGNANVKKSMEQLRNA
jgi:hypothetical protein